MCVCVCVRVCVCVCVCECAGVSSTPLAQHSPAASSGDERTLDESWRSGSGGGGEADRRGFDRKKGGRAGNSDRENSDRENSNNSDREKPHGPCDPR